MYITLLCLSNNVSHNNGALACSFNFDSRGTVTLTAATTLRSTVHNRPISSLTPTRALGNMGAKRGGSNLVQKGGGKGGRKKGVRKVGWKNA